VVMMVAWAGMAAGGYVGGVLCDASRSYTLSFLLAAAAGVLNLAVLGAFAMTMTESGRRAEARLVCSTSGSARIWPTVMRGLNEP